MYSAYTALLVLTFQGGAATLDLGIVSVALLLPALAFTLCSGRLMERLRPLGAFRVATASRAALLALAALASGRLWLLALCAGGVGLLQQVLSAAKLTFDASVVGVEERTRYNSKRAMLSGLAALLGPSLAGFLAGWCGAAVGVLTSAALGLLSLLALGRVRAPGEAAATNRAPGSAPAAGLAGALRWLRGQPQLAALISAYVVLMAILEMEAPLVFPFVAESYGRGPDVSGTLLGVCGLGSLAGALLMHRRNRPVPGWALTLLLVLDGGVLFLITRGPDLRLVYLLFSLLGVLSAVTQVTVETRAQNEVPAHLLPLVFSLMAFAGGAGGASLALPASALADVVGAAQVLAWCAGLEMAVGLAATALAVLSSPTPLASGVAEHG
jgi:hypothetical protein